MDIHRIISTWPRRLAGGSDRLAVVYELAEDVVATHGVPPVEPTLATYADERVALSPAEVLARSPIDSAQVGPVYRRRPGGALAVPTGRVLVRFVEGESVERRRPELAALGFEVDRRLSYAPHAAWLRSNTGRVGDALRQLINLERLEGIENVEPQMLTEKGDR